MNGLYVEQIQALPKNFDRFTAEVAGGLAALYGEDAAEEYAENAEPRFLETIRHPQVLTLGVSDGDVTQGIGVAIVRDDMGQIVFVHVLSEYADRGIEHHLFRSLTDILRGNRVAGIVCEFLPMCDLDLMPVEDNLEFRRIPRLMMQRSLSAEGMTEKRASREMRTTDWREAAEALVDAYRDHPGREYHAEVQNPDRAKSFITSAVHGGFGKSDAAFNRVIEIDGEIVGIMLGCRAAPSVGFVLHVAVRPQYRGKGIGETLMIETMAEFTKAGMTGAALGVTETNPARHLYERLGFEVTKKFHTSVWWNEA